MKHIKTFEGSGFGKSYPGHEEPTPKFKIGDEVMVIYDLKKYDRLYFNMVKGNIVNITDFWINANGTISYEIDSQELRKLRKGYDIRNDDFPEFHFEYEWKIDADKFNL
jgi:hypothetical protein